MLGTIIGDIAGSCYEWHNIKTKDFELLSHRCHFTDDSIMSLALAQALMKAKGDYTHLSELAVSSMQELGRAYPHGGYGSHFAAWLWSDDPQPYNSFGNGAAMRVSACGVVAKNLNEAKKLARAVTKVTHNHPEGLKAAEAVAVAVFMARSGANLLDIQDEIRKNYYPMDFRLDDIRDDYSFDVSCQGSVPQALEAFFESQNFEDTIRNAISIGGDSDTIAAIAGSIAEEYYGIPASLRTHALTFLDEPLLRILTDFENLYPPTLEKIGKGTTVPIRTDNRDTVQGSTRETLIASAVKTAKKDLAKTKTKVEETSAQKLFNHLYEACTMMRGPISHDEFKSYVIPCLFLKRLSDVYDEEINQALEDSGGDMEYAALSENHRFIIPNGAHWNDIRNCPENVGLAISKAMTAIERENPETLDGVFSSFDDAAWTDKGKLSDALLKNVIEHMSGIKVGNRNYSADVMGDAYEFLIKKFADLSKKNAGEFYTPRSIVKLMVMLLDPKPGETVYDPACGTGGMLIEAVRHMNMDHRSFGKIFGQENNLATSAIARMNLFLHGAAEFKIAQGDTLRTPAHTYAGKIKTFDCVLANPPFALHSWGADMFVSDPYGRNIWGCPSDSCADFAWLQHMVVSMNPKHGRCAVVLPQGVLFKSDKDAEIRKALVQSDKLEYIITLVGGVFYSTGVSACILFLNNHKCEEHRGKICMIDASEIYKPLRAQKIMTEENIQEVYRLATNYRDEQERVKVVTLEDVEKQGYTLSVNSYIERKPQEVIPPEVTRAEFFKALDDVKKAEARLETLLAAGGFLYE